MDNHIKVSVIIPVYNVEQYLHQCIDSILNQTLRELELICIDDGSTDRSLEILREYEKKDSRVTVLVQDNMGGGAARNKGLAIAKGEYLSFLDSDDFFEENMLEETYKRSKELNLDMCIYKIKYYNDKTGEITEAPWSFREEYVPHKEVFSYKDLSGYIFNTFQNWAWNKLIKHDMVKRNNLRFQEIKRTNDLLFVCSCLVVAERISTLGNYYAYYRVGTENNCQSTNYKAPLDFYYAFAELKKTLVRLGVYEEVEQSFSNHALSGCIYNFKTLGYTKQQETLYKLLQDEGFELFDIKNKPASYFYSFNEGNYKLYQTIKGTDYVQYILNKVNYFITKAERVDEHKTKLKHTQRRYKKLKKENDKLKKENRKLRRENRRIKDSMSYKIGRVFWFIPSKVKQIIKK